MRSTEAGKAIIEESFGGVPVVGSSRVVYEEIETVPNERIDFKLIESDKLNCFEGSWILSSAEDGKSTNVELFARLDTKLPLPFKEQILGSQGGQDMEHRLKYVKKKAESR